MNDTKYSSFALGIWKWPILLLMIGGAIAAGGYVIYEQTGEQERQINGFQDCVAAGNPVLESRPRQCNADGKTYVEL